MAQRRRKAGFAHEVGACGATVPDGLDCNAAVKTRIPGFIDFAETAFTEAGAQFVVLETTGARNGIR
jgi:hypothetical protein